MSDWRPFEPCKENVDRAVGNVFEDRMHGITTTRSVQAAISMERRRMGIIRCVCRHGAGSDPDCLLHSDYD